jgi:hypothetical protein
MVSESNRADDRVSPEPSGRLGPVGILVVAGFVLSLSSVGLLPLPVIGPAVGILLGWFALRQAARMPLLDARSLARWCMIVSAAMLFLSGVFIWKQYPQMAYQASLNDKLESFLNALARKDAEALYGTMAPDYRDHHSVDEVKAAIAGVIPDGVESAPTPENPYSALFKDYPSEMTQHFDFTLPFSDAQVALRLGFTVERSSYSEFSVRLNDFSVHRAEPAGETEAGSESEKTEPGKEKAAKESKPDGPR